MSISHNGGLFALFFVLIMALNACSPKSGGNVDAFSDDENIATISNGSPSALEPAAGYVELWWDGEFLYYGGAHLVGPSTVLLQATFASEDNYPIDDPRMEIYFVAGASEWAAEDYIDVVRGVSLKPNENWEPYNGDASAQQWNFAVMTLERPVDGVRPTPLSLRALSDLDIGRTVSMYGYGTATLVSLFTETEGDDPGIKRYTEFPISDIEGNFLEATRENKTDGSPCLGDNGNAVLLESYGEIGVAGIYVYAEGARCHRANHRVAMTSSSVCEILNLSNRDALVNGSIDCP